jgi:predicted nucleic acid-binding protein
LSAFADTSFLCALYRNEEHSALADQLMSRRSEPILVSSLVLLEFRQAARLQAFRFSRDRAHGYLPQEAEKIIRALERNVTAGSISLREVDWSQVHSVAEKLSKQHAIRHGVRLMDLLHVATALFLKTTELLSFDEVQRRVARAEGLQTMPVVPK